MIQMRAGPGAGHWIGRGQMGQFLKAQLEGVSGRSFAVIADRLNHYQDALPCAHRACAADRRHARIACRQMAPCAVASVSFAGFMLLIKGQTAAAAPTPPIADAVSVPVIASGGVGSKDHLADGVLQGGADAVLAASVFHFGEFTVAEAKRHMRERGIEVRL